VVVAPQVPENKANLALVTTHHGSTLAGGRLSTRIIEYCIRMVWESYSGGIALTSAASELVKAGLLRGRPVVRTSVRRLMDILRGLIPETIAILGNFLTNETTPAGHAHDPISGAHPILGEMPETAPEATSPSSTTRHQLLCCKRHHLFSLNQSLSLPSNVTRPLTKTTSRMSQLLRSSRRQSFSLTSRLPSRFTRPLGNTAYQLSRSPR
jgi:hypothetical protein